MTRTDLLRWRCCLCRTRGTARSVPESDRDQINHLQSAHPDKWYGPQPEGIATMTKHMDPRRYASPNNRAHWRCNTCPKPRWREGGQVKIDEHLADVHDGLDADCEMALKPPQGYIIRDAV